MFIFIEYEKANTYMAVKTRKSNDDYYVFYDIISYRYLPSLTPKESFEARAKNILMAVIKF